MSGQSTRDILRILKALFTLPSVLCLQVVATFLFCNIRQVSGQSLELFPHRLDTRSHLIIPHFQAFLENRDRIRFFLRGVENSNVFKVPLGAHYCKKKSQHEVPQAPSQLHTQNQWVGVFPQLCVIPQLPSEGQEGRSGLVDRGDVDISSE